MNGQDTNRIKAKLADLGTYDPNYSKRRTAWVASTALACGIALGFGIGWFAKPKAPPVNEAGLSWIIDQVSAQKGVLRKVAEAEVRERLGL